MRPFLSIYGGLWRGDKAMLLEFACLAVGARNIAYPSVCGMLDLKFEN